jgi:hypothetical protein
VTPPEMPGPRSPDAQHSLAWRPVMQLMQSGERQLNLGLDARSAEHLESPGLGCLPGGVQQRRLADAGISDLAAASAPRSGILSCGNRKPAKTEVERCAVIQPVSGHPRSTSATLLSQVDLLAIVREVLAAGAFLNCALTASAGPHVGPRSCPPRCSLARTIS